MKYVSPLRHAWLRILIGVAAVMWAQVGTASSGSYATAGTGTYAQSLWWLDMTGYSPNGPLTPQSFTYTLPSGAGSLTTSVNQALINGGNFAATAEPAAGAVGAFGHGAYNGITGLPILYTTTTLVAATVYLGSIVVKDASSNARTYSVYIADAENTSSAESIAFTTSGTWTLVDTVNYFTGYNGVAPALSGNSTTQTATGSGSAAYNAAYIFGSANATQVSAAVAGTQGVAFAIAMPTVTLNVVVAARSDPTDQFTAALGYTSPAVNLKTVTTTSTGTTAATGAISVIGTNSITLSASMGAGSSSTLANYSGAITCSNSGPGNTTLPSGAGTSFALTPKLGDAITCNLVLTSLAQTVGGTLYADANHDGTLSGAEAGTGLSGLYVKLATSTAGVCQSPATVAAAVNSSTGAYRIPSVVAGTYCLTLTNNATLSNTTAYLPPGYVFTEATTGVRQLTGLATSTTAQNFGLYSGSSLSLSVFGDNGVGSGTANNGVKEGAEAGFGNLLATATVSGAAVATATTDGAGAATLWLPSTVSGTVTLGTAVPAGYLATGGSAGTTAGTYARPNLTFTYAAGNAYSGVSFGLVAPNTLAPNGSQTTQPGSVVFYPHTYVAGTAGSLTLSTTAVSKPAVSSFAENLYLDSTCSGSFASSDTLITAAINVTAAQRVCFLVKEFVPAGAPFSAQNTITASASFVYSGSAAPATAVSSVTDVTTVTTVATQLTKQVQNVSTSGSYGTSNTALPGNTLQYQLTIVNQGSAALSTVVISDATPAYTTFVSAACPGTLPTSLTTCALSVQPANGATGAVQWTFGGTLAPGTQTTVTYQVTVAQ